MSLGIIGGSNDCLALERFPWHPNRVLEREATSPNGSTNRPLAVRRKSRVGRRDRLTTKPN